MAMQEVIIQMFSGRAYAKYTYARFGMFIDKTIGQIHFFNPCFAATIPPTIPPSSNAITPIVP